MSALIDPLPPSSRPRAESNGCLAFAAPRRVRVGLLGLGNVAQQVVRSAQAAASLLARRGIELHFVAALVRDANRERSALLPGARVTADRLEFFTHEFDLVIEALGGVEPAAGFVRALLRRGVPVVTANKSLLAAHGPELFELARRRGVTLRGEASVLAGVPFLESLARRPLLAQASALRGILNGTSNFVLSQMRAWGVSLSQALVAAQRAGLAEPDARADVSGRDAAEKLIVLLTYLGVRGVAREALEVRGIDRLNATDLRQAAALGGAIRPVVCARLIEDRVEAFVGPALVRFGSKLADVDGAQNALELHSVHAGSVLFAGPGAGPVPTAATILDDVWSVLGEERGADAWPEAVRTVTPVACATPWLLRFELHNPETRFTDIYNHLESAGLAVLQVCGAPPGQRRPSSVRVITGVHARAEIDAALRTFTDATGDETLAIRVLEAESHANFATDGCSALSTLEAT